MRACVRQHNTIYFYIFLEMTVETAIGNCLKILSSCQSNQVAIAQWLARRLATGEVLGPNPGKGENLLISD